MKFLGKEHLITDQTTVEGGRDLVKEHFHGMKCNHILELRDVFNVPWETIKVRPPTC